jgi:hypothetical protein
VARCHASSVRCSAGARVMVREVVRPRAILRPCMIHVSMITTGGSKRYPGTMCGKADRDDSTSGRQTRCYWNKPYAVLEVPARTARAVTGLDSQTDSVIPVCRLLSPFDTESVVAPRQWPSQNAWISSQPIRPRRAPATCGPSLPACSRTPLSPSLLRHRVQCSRSISADAVHGD